MRTAFGVDWSERIKIIYAGDDATDEDAMVVSSTSSGIPEDLLFLSVCLTNA